MNKNPIEFLEGMCGKKKLGLIYCRKKYIEEYGFYVVGVIKIDYEDRTKWVFETYSAKETLSEEDLKSIYEKVVRMNSRRKNERHKKTEVSNRG